MIPRPGRRSVVALHTDRPVCFCCLAVQTWDLHNNKLSGSRWHALKCMANAVVYIALYQVRAGVDSVNVSECDQCSGGGQARTY